MCTPSPRRSTEEYWFPWQYISSWISVHSNIHITWQVTTTTKRKSTPNEWVTWGLLTSNFNKIGTSLFYLFFWIANQISFSILSLISCSIQRKIDCQFKLHLKPVNVTILSLLFFSQQFCLEHDIEWVHWGLGDGAMETTIDRYWNTFFLFEHNSSARIEICTQEYILRNMRSLCQLRVLEMLTILYLGNTYDVNRRYGLAPRQLGLISYLRCASSQWKQGHEGCPKSTLSQVPEIQGKDLLTKCQGETNKAKNTTKHKYHV